jgi:hypothetical protein
LKQKKKRTSELGWKVDEKGHKQTKEGFLCAVSDEFDRQDCHGEAN